MRVEWLKRKIRGTGLHRLLRHLIKRSPGTKVSALLDTSATYDRQTVEVMKRVLRSDSNCIDIGAHKGDILRHMIEIAPVGSHHAFEALPYLAAELRERFPAVDVHEAAASDANGIVEFQHVENDPAYSGLRRRIYDRPDPRIATIQVKAVKLDDELSLDHPIAFVKVDIEGGEYHAIRGATNIIRRWQPVIVFEAGSNSTGQYGVTSTALYELVTQALGYHLSTMDRWMKQARPYTLDEFRHNWDNGPDYFFIATPLQGRN